MRLRSRNDRPLTEDHPELAEIDIQPGPQLDGEIVALEEAGRSAFELLQQRIHHTHPSHEHQNRVPVTFVVFDLLHRGGEELLDVPYRDRRGALRSLELDEHPRIQVPQHFTGITCQQMLDVVGAHTGAPAVFGSCTIPRLPAGAGRRSRATAAAGVTRYGAVRGAVRPHR